MDIRVSPHCDIVAFRELLDSWITEAGPGCSMEIVKVNEVKSNLYLQKQQLFENLYVYYALYYCNLCIQKCTMAYEKQQALCCKSF